jgi:AraC family transcriptional regulator
MDLEYLIETLAEKKLIGKRMTMSFFNNKTAELWRSFMMERTQVKNSLGTNLYSMQLYPPSFFDSFNPLASFEKWAVMEVADFTTVPVNMEAFVLTGGVYAVFLYRVRRVRARGYFNIFSKPGCRYPLML